MHSSTVICRLPFSIVMLGAASTVWTANAQTRFETGRYTTITNTVSYAQSHPMEVLVNSQLPQSIVTIRDAVDFLLLRSGYALANEDVHSTAALTLLSHQVPQVQRIIRQITLTKALNMLAGGSYELVVDPVHRKITFDLTPDMQKLYEGHTSAQTVEQLISGVPSDVQ